jgi:hypothetical protein
MKLILLLAALTACSPAAWQAFTNDPAAYIATYETDVEQFLSIAASIFQAIYPLLTPDQQAKAQAKYVATLDAVHHSELALNEAVKAATDAKKPIDVVALVADVSAAVTQLEQAIVDIKSMVATRGASGSDPRMDDLHRARVLVASFH